MYWLSPTEGPDSFPSPENALAEPNGLLAVGGDLSPERLLAAYPRSIFPWYEEGQPILWWSPDPRAVLFPEDLHVSRRLARTLRHSNITISVDTSFRAVIQGCATPRRYADGTWITPAMLQAYEQLHKLGYAHSFEAWDGDDLVAGMYGIAIGQVFFGESMFTRISNASKIVFVRAVEYLQSKRFELIDCQIWSDHLESLGATTVPRAAFVDYLGSLCEPPGDPSCWNKDHARYISETDF
ncbi:MAG: leucyl/phenylalanyl-tRNA--protein transferase [Pseudomonadota bacterium]|nr:leucyl/phenylalanyl-tRNA--protein transferase [Pseudomonadota bacterium]